MKMKLEKIQLSEKTEIIEYIEVIGMKRRQSPASVNETKKWI